MIRRWYDLGDRVAIRVNRRLEPGIVVDLGRVMDTVETYNGKHLRHTFEIYAREDDPDA